MASTTTIDLVIPIQRSGLPGLRTITGRPVQLMVDASFRFIVGVYDHDGVFEGSPAESNATVQVHAVDADGDVGAELFNESAAIATRTEAQFKDGTGHAAITLPGTTFPAADYEGGANIRISIWLDGVMIVSSDMPRFARGQMGAVRINRLLDVGATKFAGVTGVEALVSESLGFYQLGSEYVKTNVTAHGVNSGSSSLRYSLAHATQVGLDISTGDFVLQAWIARDVDSAASRILGKGNINATDLGYSLEVTGTTAKFRMGDGTLSAEVTGTIENRRWHHLIASADRDGNMELFIDGVSAGTVAALSATIANTVDFFMLNIDTSGTRDFKGTACMFGLWSGVTMDAAAALALYNDGIPVNYDAMTAGQKTGLVSFWELNESSDTGSVGYDRVGANNLAQANLGDTRHFRRNAAKFVAANSEYLEIAHASQSGLSPGATPFTFVAWVNTQLDTLNKAVGGKWVNPSNREWVLVQESDEEYNFYISSDGTSISASVALYGGVINFVKYKLVAAIWDGSNIHISIDGSAFTSAAFAGPVYGLGTAPFRLGSYNNSIFMDGDIANAAYWERALSLDEIKALAYNAPTIDVGVPYDELTTAQKVDLVSWWSLDEESGTRVDAHGDNDLTDNNTVGHAAGVVINKDAEYPTPENAAISAWVNRSTLADGSQFGDLRVVHSSPGRGPKKAAGDYPDWNAVSQGHFKTLLGGIAQPATVIILGQAAATPSGTSNIWFHGSWRGRSVYPSANMLVDAGTEVDSGLAFGSGAQRLWIWIFDGADSEFHQDNNSADPIPSSPGTDDLVGFELGGVRFRGYMKYAIVVPRRLTSDEITDLIADLNP